MDKNRFLELQYLTLRKEIETCLERAFQIMVGGATLIPILTGILRSYTATPILMALPMVVVVTALLYLNQWNMIMRAGRYIRTKIEPELIGGQGWEAWLEAPVDPKIGEVDNRLVDAYLMYAFYLLTGGYYFATSFIAITYAHESYGWLPVWSVTTLYVMVGLVIGVIILRRVPTNTTTKKERALVKLQRKLAHHAVHGAPSAAAHTPDEAEQRTLGSS